MTPPVVEATRDPLATLEAWRREASEAGEDADVMALATADAAGHPSLRFVLLRGIVEGRLRFFTSYGSRKARELDERPEAAVALHFRSLRRQVRVEGRVERVPPEDSDAYFRTRPRGHQLSAAVSRQSQVIASLDELRAERDDLARRTMGLEIARPLGWGGYAIEPRRVELWIGDADRLHERRSFERDGSGWRVALLAP